MKIGEAFPSKWLKADDLQGKDHTLTIKNVVIEEIQSQEGTVTKPCMYFEGAQKGLVLNLTNASACTIAFGSDDTDDWIGQKITLFPDKTTFGRQIVSCIRMRGAANVAPAIPQQAAPQVAQNVPHKEHETAGTMQYDPDLADDIPF